MDERRGKSDVIPERQAMMAGLPVTVGSALVYGILLALHQVSDDPLVHAIGVAVVMGVAALGLSFMFSPSAADTRTAVAGAADAGNVDEGFSSVPHDREGSDLPGVLSMAEEERLISQLEHELDDLETQCRQEFAALQDASNTPAGGPGATGRLWWGRE